ncbi:MAG: phenylalanine--tRNA ligase subunit beta [Bacteroidetes bacterium]|nr:phenylalanine--tRNA ligase subunit beta [Bacteroidota bacterium]
MALQQILLPALSLLVIVLGTISALLFFRNYKKDKKFQSLESRLSIFENICSQANDALFVIDIANGGILKTNDKAAKMLGYSITSLEKMSIFNIHPPEHLNKSAETIADVWEKGGMVYQDIPFITASGELLPVECSAKVLPLDERPSIVIYARDITKRLKMEKEIREQSEIISQRNKEIIDSIRYAGNIQQAILPNEQELKNILSDHFIFFQPKDIVSGDFYWVHSSAHLTPSPPEKEKPRVLGGETERRKTKRSDSYLITDSPIHPFTPEYSGVSNGDGVIFEIGLTPNRADATSHFGVARELKALLKRKAALPSVDNFHIDNHNNHIDVIVEDHLACPRYAGVTISGITVKESPEWLQNRLNSVGLKPINNVVDVTNFVLQECGQPLHAFDTDEIIDKKVIVKTLPGGSRFKTLDGVERKLSKADLMICNAKEPMCIAGVFGGEKSGVKQTTKDIFLESAYFSPETIRKTAQNHGLQTDASFRFERGTDPNMVIYALKRASVLIKELAGGAISSDIVDIYPEPLKNFEVKISYKNVERLIGKKLKEVEIKKILEYLDIKIIAEDVSGLKLSVPPYRVDVQREADIIEEILRIYGYDNIDINADLRTDYLADFPETDKEKIQNSIADLLSANGFNEIITNSLTNSVYTQKMRSRSLSAKDKSGGAGEDVFKFQDVKIINKLSDELGVLRQTMLFSGLEVIAHNVNRRQKDLKFYEFGKIYYKNNNKNTDDRVHVFKYSRVHGSSLEHKNTRTQEHILKGHTAAGSGFTQQAALQGYREENHLAIFMTGSKYSETWQQPNKNLDFHDIASYVYKILLNLNINNYDIKNINNDAIFDNGLICTANNKAIVKFGIVRHDLASLVPGIQLREHIYYADFDWDVIINRPGRKIQVVSVPKYPEVRRDLSMILDNSVKFDDIKRLALKAEKKLLREVNVFDIYEGKSIDKSKKSYAISFILQDYNQTLTDKVIDKTMQRLMNVFETELNAVIRK